MTRYQPPPLPGCLVERPRLKQILRDADQYPLVLAVGPPGSGKTTVLLEWLAELEPGSYAWVAASESLGRHASFPAVLVDALEHTWPGSGRGVRSLADGTLDPDALGSMFPPEIGDATVHRYLVIDDAHVLRDRVVRRVLLQLVEHAPKGFHLVLGTRSDPEMPLHRMRVHGDVLELRDADLRFQRSETASFLAKSGLGDMTEAHVDLLDERTEGWPAGLRLAALSLRHEEDPESFLATFAGNDRNVADYLIHEVLDHQPEDVYWFLLDTAPFDIITPALCEAVTGQAHTSAYLELLEREHLFVSRLNSEDDSYRYHELFRDMLRYVLRSRHHDREREVLEAGAAWHESRGDHVHAVAEWLSAGATGHAVGTMSRFSDPLLDDDGSADLVRRWTESTPELVLANDVWVVLGHAARLGWAHRWDGQAHALDRADELLAETGDPATVDLTTAVVSTTASADQCAAMVTMVLRGVALLATCELTKARDMLKGALHAADIAQAEETLPPLAVASAKRAELGLAVAHLYLGASTECRAVAARSKLWSTSDPGVTLFTRSIQAIADYGEGSLRSAQHRLTRLTEDARALHLDRPGQRAPMVASLLNGWLALEHQELGEARRQFEDHMTTTEEPLGPIALFAELGMIDTIAAGGAIDDAFSRLDLVRRRRRGLTDPIALGWIDVSECQLLLDHGQVAPAREMVAAMPETPAFKIMSAWIELAAGNTEVARLRSVTAGGQSPRFVLARSLIECCASITDGIDPPAEAMTEVLRAGESEGFVRSVIRWGRPAVDRMLVDPELSGTEYVQTLRAVVDNRPAATVASGRRAGLIEPLSEREREVMRYLPTRLSIREIAAELFVSVNTVKTHVQAIYRKLGCNSRDEAVERARALHMLV